MTPIGISEKAQVLTPDDLMDGARPSGTSVVIFDDDHYYMAASSPNCSGARGMR